MGATDLNFSISTEGLQEKGTNILEEAKTVEAALDEIDAARKSLDGWVSQNKDRYDSKLAKELPKLREMIDVINSYGGVAVQTADRIVNVESKIAAAIDNDDIAA